MAVPIGNHWLAPVRPSRWPLAAGIVLMILGTVVSWIQPAQPDVVGPAWFVVTGGGVLLLVAGSALLAWTLGWPWLALLLSPLLLFLYALPDPSSVAPGRSWDEALHHLERTGYAYPAVVWVLVGAVSAGWRRASAEGTLWPRLAWGALGAWIVFILLHLWGSWAPGWWPLGGLEWIRLFSLLVVVPVPFLVFALRDPLLSVAAVLAVVLNVVGSPYVLPWERGDWLGFGEWAPLVGANVAGIGAWAASGWVARSSFDRWRGRAARRRPAHHVVTEGEPVGPMGPSGAGRPSR